MPVYDWENKKTGEIKTIECKIAERNTPPDESGDWKRIEVYTVGKSYAVGWRNHRKGKYNSKGD